MQTLREPEDFWKGILVGPKESWYYHNFVSCMSIDIDTKSWHWWYWLLQMWSQNMFPNILCSYQLQHRIWKLQGQFQGWELLFGLFIFCNSPVNNIQYVFVNLSFSQPSLGVAPPGHALLYVILGPVGPYYSTGTFNPVTLYADTENVRAWKGGAGNAKMGR